MKKPHPAKNPEKEALIKKCYGYYVRKLTAEEISKLTGQSISTVRRIISGNGFAKRANPPKPRDYRAEALKLHREGNSLGAIAKAIGKGKTTVYRYLTAANAEAPDAAPAV